MWEGPYENNILLSRRYFRIHLLTNIFFVTPKFILRILSWLFTEMYRFELLNSLYSHLRSNKPCSPFLLQLSYYKQVCFEQLFSVIFCPCCWWFHCLKYLPNIVLKCCPVLLSIRRPWCILLRKYMLNKFHLSVSYSHWPWV